MTNNYLRMYGIEPTKQMLDDIFLLFGKSSRSFYGAEDYERLGHDAWCADYLGTHLHICVTLWGLDPAEVVDRLSTLALGVRCGIPLPQPTKADHEALKLRLREAAAEKRRTTVWS